MTSGGIESSADRIVRPTEIRTPTGLVGPAGVSLFVHTFGRIRRCRMPKARRIGKAESTAFHTPYCDTDRRIVLFSCLVADCVANVRLIEKMYDGFVRNGVSHRSFRVPAIMHCHNFAFLIKQWTSRVTPVGPGIV
jgi:hypothetical protein